MSGLKLPDAFRKPNEDGVRGGVEPGFMSTTLNKEVAFQYANGDGNHSTRGIVFEISQGLVDRGASITWLSQYPHEEETLFAPLAGLQVVSTQIERTVLVVSVRNVAVAWQAASPAIEVKGAVVRHELERC